MYKEQNYRRIDKTKPLLLIAGGEDPVGEKGKSVERLFDFYTQTVGVESVEKIIYEGVRHEYFNDTSKEKAFNAVKEFVDGVILND